MLLFSCREIKRTKWSLRKSIDRSVSFFGLDTINGKVMRFVEYVSLGMTIDNNANATRRSFR